MSGKSQLELHETHVNASMPATRGDAHLQLRYKDHVSEAGLGPNSKFQASLAVYKTLSQKKCVCGMCVYMLWSPWIS